MQEFVTIIATTFTLKLPIIILTFSATILWKSRYFPWQYQVSIFDYSALSDVYSPPSTIKSCPFTLLNASTLGLNLALSSMITFFLFSIHLTFLLLLLSMKLFSISASFVVFLSFSTKQCNLLYFSNLPCSNPGTFCVLFCA